MESGWTSFYAESTALSRLALAEDRVQVASNATEEPCCRREHTATVIPAKRHAGCVNAVDDSTDRTRTTAITRIPSYEAVMTLDGDGQQDPDEIPAYCRTLEKLAFSSEGYTAEVDMSAHFSPLNLRTTEVPILVTHSSGMLARNAGITFIVLAIGAEIFTFARYYRNAQFYHTVFTIGITALILGSLLITVRSVLNSLVSILQYYTRKGSP